MELKSKTFIFQRVDGQLDIPSLAFAQEYGRTDLHFSAGDSGYHDLSNIPALDTVEGDTTFYNCAIGEYVYQPNLKAGLMALLDAGMAVGQKEPFFVLNAHGVYPDGGGDMRAVILTFYFYV